MRHYWLETSLLALATGCSTMPTPEAEIDTKAMQTTKYDAYNCNQLNEKLGLLRHEVMELTLRQEKRITDSSGHALYYGWGKGNGMDTIELVKTKSEIMALDYQIKNKGCQAQ